MHQETIEHRYARTQILGQIDNGLHCHQEIKLKYTHVDTHLHPQKPQYTGKYTVLGQIDHTYIRHKDPGKQALGYIDNETQIQAFVVNRHRHLQHTNNRAHKYWNTQIEANKYWSVHRPYGMQTLENRH